MNKVFFMGGGVYSVPGTSYPLVGLNSGNIEGKKEEEGGYSPQGRDTNV